MSHMQDRWPLGVFASIDAGLGVSLDVARELGVPTLHLHAPRSPQRTPDTAREFQARLAEQQMSVSCVFAGFEGESYTDIPTVAQTVGLVPAAFRMDRIRELEQIADFARWLDVKPVGLHLGVIPHNADDPALPELVAVVQGVCDYLGDQQQALHLETGQEPAEALLQLLDEVDRPNLFINFDPANMILYGCGEPLAALRRVGRFVRSVHCKDARWSDQPGVTWGHETPLGDGDVDLESLLGTLADIGYDGPLTIEREIPQQPDRQRAEIAQAVERLNQAKRQVLR